MEGVKKSDNILKEYSIYFIQQRYKIYSQMMYNYQAHIELLHAEFIINITERNNYLKIVNELLKTMNSKYNTVMLDICESKNKNTNVNNLNKIIINNSSNFEEVLKLHNIKLIRLYAYIVELEYYLYMSVKYEKLLNIKYNKNK